MIWRDNDKKLLAELNTMTHHLNIFHMVADIAINLGCYNVPRVKLTHETLGVLSLESAFNNPTKEEGINMDFVSDMAKPSILREDFVLLINDLLEIFGDALSRSVYNFCETKDILELFGSLLILHNKIIIAKGDRSDRQIFDKFDSFFF